MRAKHKKLHAHECSRVKTDSDMIVFFSQGFGMFGELLDTEQVGAASDREDNSIKSIGVSDGKSRSSEKSLFQDRKNSGKFFDSKFF